MSLEAAVRVDPGLGRQLEPLVLKLQTAYRMHRAQREMLGLSTLPKSARGSSAFECLLSPRPTRRAKTISDIVLDSDVISSNEKGKRLSAEERELRTFMHSSFAVTSPREPSVLKAKTRLRRIMISRCATLSKGVEEDDSLAMVLAEKQWVEMMDSKHRYGKLLAHYFQYWKDSACTETSFFYWLDAGRGSTLSLPCAPREKLEASKVKYLNANEREAYAFGASSDGKLVYSSNKEFLDGGAEEGQKLIFVLSLDDVFYAGIKVRGSFHHSSFLAGRPVKSAGNMTVDKGVLTALSPHSGHYRPTQKQFDCALSTLRSMGVEIDGKVKLGSVKNIKDAGKTRMPTTSFALSL